MQYSLIPSFLCTVLILSAQTGPYPIFELPPDSAWSQLDSNRIEHRLISALAGQPQMPTARPGVVISPQGLALFPSGLLDGEMLRSDTWLADDDGRSLPLSPAEQPAVLVKVEDISEEILAGLPDTISPGTRAIRIANRLLKYRREEAPPGEIRKVHAFYGSNRYYRFHWRLQNVRLLGQIVMPTGASFLLTRLQPDGGPAKSDYAYLPLPDQKNAPQDLYFACGWQTFPQTWPPATALRYHYGERLPLLEEVRQVVAEAWRGSEQKPAWLERVESAAELEMPLHPFADPAQALAEAQNRENALLAALQHDRDRWYKTQQRLDRMATGYEALAPYLTARTLSLELIPTRIELFRLLGFLIKWRERITEAPELAGMMTRSVQAFLTHFYETFDAEADQAAAAELFALYMRRVRYDLQSPYAVEQWRQMKKDPRVMALALYEKSNLTDPAQTLAALEKDPAAFLENLPRDYAFRFIQTWLSEHRERLNAPIRKRQTDLAEEQRKMLDNLLRYAPGQAAVERGGLSFTRLTTNDLKAAPAHRLGNYPAGSPVLTANGALAGLTWYDGDNPFFQGQTSNWVISIEALGKTLQEKYPAHRITREWRGEK